VFCSGRKFHERREYCDKGHLRLQQTRYSTSDKKSDWSCKTEGQTVCCYKDCGYWEQTLPSVYQQHISCSTVDRYCVSELAASSSSNKPRISCYLLQKGRLIFERTQLDSWPLLEVFLQLHPLNSGTVSYTSLFKLHLSVLSSPTCLYFLSGVLRFPGQNFV